MGIKHLTHVPCEECDSSDAVTVWLESNRHYVAKCFSCKTTYQTDNQGHKIVTTKATKQIARELGSLQYAKVNYPEGEQRVCTWKDSGIYKEIAEAYEIKRINGDSRVYFPYYHESRIVGLKVRNYGVNKKDKGHFYVLGTTNGLFFGQQLYQRNFKRLLIVEGEWDTAAAKAMLQESKYTTSVAVVGVPGTDALEGAIRQNYEWLSSFDSITVCMDGDKAGRQAAAQALDILPPVSLRVIVLDEGDDPRSLLKEGRVRYFQRLFQQAPTRQLPSWYNINWFDNALASKDVADPMPTTIEPLDEMLSGGLRPGGVSVVLADPGQGKSTLAKVVLAGLLDTEYNCAVVSLEEEDSRFMRHVLQAYTFGELESLSNTDSLRELEHRCPVFRVGKEGYTLDTVKQFIRLSVIKSGADVVVVDTLTKLCHTDMTQTIKAMEALDDLSKELNIHVMVLGHQARGKKFEDLTAGVGSGAIERYAEVVIKLKREGDDVTLYLAKDRPCGNYATVTLRFDKRTYEYQRKEEAVQAELIGAKGIPEISQPNQEVEETDGTGTSSITARFSSKHRQRAMVPRNKGVREAINENMVENNGSNATPTSPPLYSRSRKWKPYRK